jgi:hypothetical protein
MPAFENMGEKWQDIMDEKNLTSMQRRSRQCLD